MTFSLFTYNLNLYKKSFIILFFTFSIYPFASFSQSLFESAVVNNINQEAAKYNINSYLRSGLFSGDEKFKDIYAEGAFKLNITGNQYGNASAELRYRVSPGEPKNNIFSLREGYINLFLGKFDFRIGQQIIVWGRADGFNPTNNITPNDFTVFSPNEDDKRLSNFVAKGVYNAYPFKIELDWVPIHKSSVLPFENAILPVGVEWIDSGILLPEWDNSSFGLKLDMEKPSFDGSLSYYNGYNKLPGIQYTAFDNGFGIYTQSYRTQVYGADFSTTLNKYGFRGEFAYSLPNDKNGFLFSVPCQQLEYTLGIDREWKNFNLILQYVGKYIIDFNPDFITQNELISKIIHWNRMIFSQQKTWNHSVSIRSSVNLFHETLKCELLGLANFSTKEMFLFPKITYNISDAFKLYLGTQLFNGPNNTLYGYMKKNRNTVFVELKISF